MVTITILRSSAHVFLQIKFVYSGHDTRGEKGDSRGFRVSRVVGFQPSLALRFWDLCLDFAVFQVLRCLVGCEFGLWVSAISFKVPIFWIFEVIQSTYITS